MLPEKEVEGPIAGYKDRLVRIDLFTLVGWGGRGKWLKGTLVDVYKMGTTTVVQLIQLLPHSSSTLIYCAVCLHILPGAAQVSSKYSFCIPMV